MSETNDTKIHPRFYKPKRNPTAGFQRFGNEATVVLPDGACIKVLNDVGARIWELIDGNRTVSDIVDTIHEEFDTTREQAELDVCDFIRTLDEHEMLQG